MSCTCCEFRLTCILVISIKLMTSPSFPAHLHTTWVVGRSENIRVALQHTDCTSSSIGGVGGNGWLFKELATPESPDSLLSHQLVAECGSPFFASPVTITSVDTLRLWKRKVSHSLWLYSVLSSSIWRHTWTQLCHSTTWSLTVNGTLPHIVHISALSSAQCCTKDCKFDIIKKSILESLPLVNQLL